MIEIVPFMQPESAYARLVQGEERFRLLLVTGQ
jgi:hypothetical protein